MNIARKKHSLILVSLIAVALLIMVGTLICATSGTAYAAGDVATVQTDAGPTNYTDVASAWSAANSAGTATVTLLADVITTNTLTVDPGNNITLDLNGKMLKYSNSSAQSSVITVSGNLILTDSEKDLPQKDKTPHNYNVTDGLWIFDDNGEKTMYGGVNKGRSGQ